MGCFQKRCSFINYIIHGNKYDKNTKKLSLGGEQCQHQCIIMQISNTIWPVKYSTLNLKDQISDAHLNGS